MNKDWAVGKRIARYGANGHNVIVLHGGHAPLIEKYAREKFLEYLKGWLLKAFSI